MAESSRWWELQDEGILKMTEYLNMAEYLNMTKVRHFMEKGWPGGKIMGSKSKDSRFEYCLPDHSFFKDGINVITI
jgi:hypothetical protein